MHLLHAPSVTKNCCEFGVLALLAAMPRQWAWITGELPGRIVQNESAARFLHAGIRSQTRNIANRHAFAGRRAAIADAIGESRAGACEQDQCSTETKRRVTRGHGVHLSGQSITAVARRRNFLQPRRSTGSKPDTAVPVVVMGHSRDVSGPEVRGTSSLRLVVPLRSFRAEMLSEFVSAVVRATPAKLPQMASTRLKMVHCTG